MHINQLIVKGNDYYLLLWLHLPSHRFCADSDNSVTVLNSVGIKMTKDTVLQSNVVCFAVS